MSELTDDLITFGKYRGRSIVDVLKDRNYCLWLLKQDWFKKSYEYLYNRVSNYKPDRYFLKDVEVEDVNFLKRYKYFLLKKVEDVDVELTEEEKMCYVFYRRMIRNLKKKICDRVENMDENIYDIKAPTNWLKDFESKYGISRKSLKEFLYMYDLPNIPVVIEDIKREGGMTYNGGNAFKIAKERSSKQEALWEKRLKEIFGEDVSMQFKYVNCIFDFINIKTNTIYECKLNLKDFNEEQYEKYVVVLNKYRLLYLIDTDCLIDIERNVLYSENVDKYEMYRRNIKMLNKISKMDDYILKIDMIQVENICEKLKDRV